MQNILSNNNPGGKKKDYLYWILYDLDFKISIYLIINNKTKKSSLDLDMHLIYTQ